MMPTVSVSTSAQSINPGTFRQEITMVATSSLKIATNVVVNAEPQQTGAKLVVRALEAQGVTHVFGIPGAKIDAVFNELVDSKIQARQGSRSQPLARESRIS
jgi:hypothetical protein